MTSEHAVHFSSGSPETVLDPLDPDLAAALDAARSLPLEQRRKAVAAVAARDPHCLQAWADLAELADDPIDRYAFARVGYHRGLDALRAAFRTRSPCGDFGEPRSSSQEGHHAGWCDTTAD